MSPERRRLTGWHWAGIGVVALLIVLLLLSSTLEAR
jgi:hypothetical protein